MYIAIEGLPFTGKRRLVRQLTKDDKSWIPQYDFPMDMKRQELDGQELDDYLLELRMQDAKAYVDPHERYCVETSPLTSLVYARARGCSDEEFQSMVDRLLGTPPPYLYVYIKPDIEKCLRAARRKKQKVSREWLVKLEDAYIDAISSGITRFLLIEPDFKPAQIKRLINEKTKHVITNR